MEAASSEIAFRHWKSNSPRSFICFVVVGNSQSKSIPSNPNVRATSIVELMKVARAVGSEAMKAKSVELLVAPPMERRVGMGGVLVLKVLVKVVREVATVVEPSTSSSSL